MWLKSNLQFNTGSEQETRISDESCGLFYDVDVVMNVCPEGWRLPTADDVKVLIKLQKRKKINISDTLDIILCGRIDYEKHAKYGIQNTFWLNGDLEDGHITHWHTFGKNQELHQHDVVVARRKFPVRCVRKIEK